MTENLPGKLWKSALPVVVEIPMKEEKVEEADTKREYAVFHRKFTDFLPDGTFQKPGKGTTQNHSAFKKINYRFENTFKLTIPCSLCNQELCVFDFFAHKRQHKAMAMMGYNVKDREKPKPRKILAQRNFLISTLIEAYLYKEKTREKIDNAYEFLCKDNMPSYYQVLTNTFNSSVHLRRTDNPLVNAVAICEDQNKTWRSVMEDRYVFQGRYGKKSNVCFFGLFDGHHGSGAAEITALELSKFFLDQLAQSDFSYKQTKKEKKFIQSFDTVFKEEYRQQEYTFSSQKRKYSSSNYNYEWIHKAFAKAFWRMDRALKLGRKEVSNFCWSGCSAVACLLECDEEFGSSTSWKTASFTEDSEVEVEEKSFRFSNQFENSFGVLHIANVGNVHVVLCKGGQAHLLTKEHTTRILSERHRVLNGGGKISSNEPSGFTEGIVKITRGLGFHGNPKLRKSVIPVPQTISVSIDDTCQFLIVATTGLWDVIDQNEAAATAMSLFGIYEEIYKTTKREMYRSRRNRIPFLPSLSSSTISVQDGKIKLLYRNTSAFLEKMSQQSTIENSQLSTYSKNRDSLTSRSLDKGMDSKFKLSSETDFSSTKPFYLYGIEDSDETSSSTSYESSLVEEDIDRNFFEYAAEYISNGLVKAALTAGSRENITVLVMLFKGCGYQLYGSEI
ncbi:protein phosphatase 2C-like domain-containing protein 1 [Sarcophilus harrisii]|uniref:Protein phosphatase 2C like domain containing 1 n=1 Tax=Sarcophilus harrisii TaxID=9305 RepID=G3VYQ9_SARHA|nr:protein phosphatase 2C-like domain-containing protein 1 [Sarcophilus harrisii]